MADIVLGEKSHKGIRKAVAVALTATLAGCLGMGGGDGAAAAEVENAEPLRVAVLQ